MEILLNMDNDFKPILDYLSQTYGFDFSSHRMSTLEREIGSRMSVLNLEAAPAYIRVLEDSADEVTTLIDCLTVNVSRFFRNPLTFEHLARRTLPAIVAKKTKASDRSLRVWSAGCSRGEEPYSIAILINEIMEKENKAFDLNIFATDINTKVLETVEAGAYQFDQIKNVKHGWIHKYFTRSDDTYVLSPKIRNMVHFSFYNMIDAKTYVPPESVFGNFDLVLCRNLVIYFKAERQAIIFEKLFNALAPDGYLVLGEAEKLPARFETFFYKENDYSHIYRKYS